MNKNDTTNQPAPRPMLKLLQETEMRDVEGGEGGDGRLLGTQVTPPGAIGSRLIEYQGCSWTWIPFKG